jgi:hypothetical protein
MRSRHVQRQRFGHGRRMRFGHGQRTRSRSLIVGAAWVLGILTAGGGSFLAGVGIAHLSPGPQTAVAVQRAGAVHQAVISQPAKDSATPQLQPSVSATPPATSPAGSQSTSPAGSQARSPAGSQARSPAPQAAPAPSPASGGSLFTSPGGSVVASCQSGLAYLQSWTPTQGYTADDVIRGPVTQASIGFQQGTSEYAITVTCSGSNPVAKVTAG